MNKKVTFSLEEKLLKELKSKSDSSLIPQSRIVSEAIKKYLKELSK